MKTAILLLAIALAGCNGPRYDAYGNRDSSMDAFWLGMAGMGANMMTAPAAPRPTTTNCSTFGQRGMGMSCTSY